METTNKQPEFNSKSFICPHCHVFAEQKWKMAFTADVKISGIMTMHNTTTPTISNLRSDPNIYWTICNCCNKSTFWFNKQMIYPLSNTAAPANSYMPDKVRKIYDEAAIISNLSPKSAAALLRLALQILLKEIGGKGKNIDADIAELLQSNRISHQVQQACDILRVIGNNAVHPGQIDIDDDPETVKSLFSLLNFIVSETIQKEAEINKLFNSLPDNALKGIERRNSKFTEKSDNQ